MRGSITALRRKNNVKNVDISQWHVAGVILATARVGHGRVIRGIFINLSDGKK
jgi:hypothetical protein